MSGGDQRKLASRISASAMATAGSATYGVLLWEGMRAKGENLVAVLDVVFGAGCYEWDDKAGCYLTNDPRYRGGGVGIVAIYPDASWHSWSVPKTEIH